MSPYWKNLTWLFLVNMVSTWTWIGDLTLFQLQNFCGFLADIICQINTYLAQCTMEIIVYKLSCLQVWWKVRGGLGWGGKQGWRSVSGLNFGANFLPFLRSLRWGLGDSYLDGSFLWCSKAPKWGAWAYEPHWCCHLGSKLRWGESNLPVLFIPKSK